MAALKDKIEQDGRSMPALLFFNPAGAKLFVYGFLGGLAAAVSSLSYLSRFSAGSSPAAGILGILGE